MMEIFYININQQCYHMHSLQHLRRYRVIEGVFSKCVACHLNIPHPLFAQMVHGEMVI